MSPSSREIVSRWKISSWTIRPASDRASATRFVACSHHGFAGDRMLRVRIDFLEFAASAGLSPVAEIGGLDCRA